MGDMMFWVGAFAALLYLLWSIWCLYLMSNVRHLFLETMRLKDQIAANAIRLKAAEDARDSLFVVLTVDSQEGNEPRWFLDLRRIWARWEKADPRPESSQENES